MHQFMAPVLNAKESNDFTDELSLFFDETGTPFSRIEHPRLRNALEIFRKDVKLPSRKYLSTQGLEKCYLNISLL